MRKPLANDGGGLFLFERPICNLPSGCLGKEGLEIAFEGRLARDPAVWCQVSWRGSFDGAFIQSTALDATRHTA
jgi:hypothetical protein